MKREVLPVVIAHLGARIILATLLVLGVLAAQHCGQRTVEAVRAVTYSELLWITEGCRCH